MNVWLALASVGHIHHTTALEWFEESPGSRLHFCRVTQQALLRLLTNARVMGTNVLPASDAWALYDNLCADARAVFLPEPPALEELWRHTSLKQGASANFWTDAYLAAFAEAAHLTLVTFDQDLARRHGSRVRLLNPVR